MEVDIPIIGESVSKNPLARIQNAMAKVLDEEQEKNPGLGWTIILALPTEEGHLMTWTSSVLSKDFVSKVLNDYEQESAVDISGLVN